jgi:hypothetical protein
MKARIRPIPPEEATGETAALFKGVTRLLGRVANSFRVMGHQPYVAKMILPLTVSLMREGLGTTLSTKIKEMAVIKTSHLNGCAY